MPGHVHLRGFGPLRGRLPAQAPVGDGSLRGLRTYLVTQDASLAPWLEVSVFFVDGSPAMDPLQEGCTVELLPPVSGG